MPINVGEVAMIPITSVVINERARQDLGDLQSLEESLKKSGLIQPLAVEQIGDDYHLIAGERRFTVLLKNGTSTIPVRIFKDLSELDRKVLEQAENFHRKDMEYWEYDKLIHEIHTLEQEIHGKALSGGAANGTGHSLKDTAEMFGVSNVTVHNSNKRAEAREAFPELFEKCKTAKDADTVMKKLDEAIVKKSIAEKVERESNPKSTVSKLANAYIIGSFFDGVKKIPDGTIHLVEIDPPYAIDLNSVKKAESESKYTKDDYNEVSSKEYQKFLSNTFKECYRVMANHSWLVCWFAPEPWFEIIFRELEVAGFSLKRMCGIWTKPGGQSLSPNTNLANAYEMFFYAAKGKPALNKAGRSNIFNYPPVPPQKKVHQTERPVELMEDLYDTFAFPGSRVLIPFLGSGNGLIAAHRLNMSGLGFELSRSYRDSFLVKVNGGI
jgi:DNA modification methylase/3-dehydroquinate dehydratase